jgi:hypothetical protein
VPNRKIAAAGVAELTTEWRHIERIVRDRIEQLRRRGFEPDESIVAEMIEHVVDVDRRQPRVGPGGYGNIGLPPVRTFAEREEAARQRRIDIEVDGDDAALVLGCNRLPPTRDEVADAEAIAAVLPTLVTGEKNHRDWKILLHLAAGMSLRSTGEFFKIEKRRVSIIRDKRVADIWKGIAHLVAAQSETGVVWSDRLAA